MSSPTTAFSRPVSTATSDLESATTLGPKPTTGTVIGVAEMAARINAAMMALVDAGISSRGMLVAVAVAFLPRTSGENDSEMLLDPTPEEESDASSCHLFAFSFGVGVGGVEGECVGVESAGRFDEDEASRLFDAQAAAQKAAQAVLAFIRKSLEAKYGANGEGPTPARVKRQVKTEPTDDQKSDSEMDDA
ncbi:exosome non-catalytic core subunit rrp46 [Microbotryomycetes sp. JL201]|nr:exosome non-catalytic core subunit rrp46 [Microbotryomycetes sp. JL201]